LYYKLLSYKFELWWIIKERLANSC
jgi:hypothetical protein